MDPEILLYLGIEKCKLFHINILPQKIYVLVNIFYRIKYFMSTHINVYHKAIGLFTILKTLSFGYPNKTNQCERSGDLAGYNGREIALFL